MQYAFQKDLEDGGLLERLILRDFSFRQVPIQKQTGKSDFDFQTPAGRLEAKFDLLSGFTGHHAIEDKIFSRKWDYLWVATLMHKIYTRQEYNDIANETSGRKRMKMGDQEDNWGTLVPLSALKEKGLYEGQFMRALQQYQKVA